MSKVDDSQELESRLLDEKNPQEKSNQHEKQTEEKNLSFWIDLRMLPSKISYALIFAMTGAWWPYMMLFLISIGLTPFQGGVVVCLRTAMSGLSAPFWGFVSDYSGRERL